MIGNILVDPLACADKDTTRIDSVESYIVIEEFGRQAMSSDAHAENFQHVCYIWRALKKKGNSV